MSAADDRTDHSAKGRTEHRVTCKAIVTGFIGGLVAYLRLSELPARGIISSELVEALTRAG
jgi:hypothetical protein